MDHKDFDTPGNDNWLDEILGTSDTAKELGPDELAIQAAGLTHPNDAELEKILSEDWENVPDLETPVEQAPVTPAFEAELEIDLSQDELFREDFPKEPELPLAETADPEPAEPPVTLDETAEVSLAEPQKEPDQERTQYFAPVAQTQVIPVPQEPAVAETEPKVKERKIRPKFKKGYGLFAIPHILSTGIWLVLILVIGLTVGNLLWVSTSDLMAFGKPDQQITITITEKEIKIDKDGNKTVDMEAIANKLGKAGLIKYPNLFQLFAEITDKDQDIDPGTYTLNSIYDYNAMINHMSDYQSARKEIDIMIPEGYTCAQIFSLLEENGVCSVADMEAYMVQSSKEGIEGYWFLEDIPREGKYWLEGYMFPDTHRFYVDDDPENVVKKFLDDFDYRFTDIMRDKLETIEDRTGLDLDIRDVVIIASMIEKETSGRLESYDISAVLFNRLNHAADFPYLNIDATLIYALGGNTDPETGEVKPLTEQDFNMDHPYNTYNHRGLPPGPISNPGRDSLDAALTPTEGSNYYYYVYNPQEKKHIFATTLSEHEKNVEYVNSLD